MITGVLWLGYPQLLRPLCSQCLPLREPRKLASLQPANGPLGWDNWFCISHWKGWNNIQDGQYDRELANLPAAPYFDCRCALSTGQRTNLSGFHCCPIYIRLKSADRECSQRCHCEHPPKSWTCSSLELGGTPRPALFALADPDTSSGSIALSFTQFHSAWCKMPRLDSRLHLQLKCMKTFVFALCVCLDAHAKWCFSQRVYECVCMKKLSDHFCDVDKWFIQQEWWTICLHFFFLQKAIKHHK